MMRDLKTRLMKNREKMNLQFPVPVREYFERNAGFTDEELSVLRHRASGMTVLETSFAMQDKYGSRYPSGLYGVEKVERRIRSIKNKIAQIL